MSKFRSYLLLHALLCNSLIAEGQSDSAAIHADSSLVVVEKLGINSPQSDFAPFRLGNKLYFVSGRVSQLAVQYANENNDTEITDIYEATVKNPKKVSGVQPVDNVNTKYHEGPLVVSRDGNRMYLTSSDKKTKRLKLYASELVSGEWSKPTVMPFCKDSFSYCHPAISVSGDTLYFSASCCGQGKMDICYAVKKGEGWSDVSALDEHVNSNSNELFPFIGPEGLMYFASDRPGGLGGLDIYRCAINDKTRPSFLVNPPINSAADDFGIWTDSSAKSGYFSSNRSKGTGDDLYFFSRPIPDFADAEAAPVPKRFCCDFFEETSPIGVDSITLSYSWHFGDGSTGTGSATEHCFEKPGMYDVRLYVIQKGKVFVDSSLAKYEVDIPEPDRLHILSPDTASATSEIKFSSQGSKVKGYEIKETYWSFGDGSYGEGPESKHVFKNKGKYIVQLWVVGVHKKDQNTRRFKLNKEIVVEKAR